MAPEVVLQEMIELLDCVQVTTAGNESAASQVFVEGDVLSAVEFIDGHLPHRERACGAFSSVASTLVIDPSKIKTF